MSVLSAFCILIFFVVLVFILNLIHIFVLHGELAPLIASDFLFSVVVIVFLLNLFIHVEGLWSM